MRYLTVYIIEVNLGRVQTRYIADYLSYVECRWHYNGKDNTPLPISRAFDPYKPTQHLLAKCGLISIQRIGITGPFYFW